MYSVVWVSRSGKGGRDRGNIDQGETSARIHLLDWLVTAAAGSPPAVIFLQQGLGAGRVGEGAPQ